MKQNIYVVTGATGNIGKRVAEALLNQGKNVRVIGRDIKKLSALVKLGAEPFAGSLDDKAFVTRAFSGAAAAFVMIPPDYASATPSESQRKVGEAIAEALEKNKVRYAVNLSSLGAELPSGTGPIKGLHAQEARLNALTETNVVHLRPGFFMENLYIQIGLIKNLGITGTPLKEDLKLPLTATEDIAAVASALLSALDFTGKSVQEILGERDVTMKEATEILSKTLARPELKYVAFPYDAAEKGMVESGLSLSTAKQFNEMYLGLNEGRIHSLMARTGKSTTATSIEAFARHSFAPVFQG